MNPPCKSIAQLASEHPNLALYLTLLERERHEMLSFIREQMEMWNSDGDSGFPLYELGADILRRNK